MFLAFKAFSVDFVNIFRAGGAGGKPAVFRYNFQAANRGIVARSAGQFADDLVTRKCFQRELFRGELAQFGFLFRIGGRVNPRIERRAQTALSS